MNRIHKLMNVAHDIQIVFISMNAFHEIMNKIHELIMNSVIYDFLTVQSHILPAHKNGAKNLTQASQVLERTSELFPIKAEAIPWSIEGIELWRMRGGFDESIILFQIKEKLLFLDV